ncbi:dynamin family protein [Arcobacter porcinus]|uniref:GTP-binding protein (Dynamin domain) n=1 Tax=Arcobacter porcinus TaxID=1935204 RepID=A0A5C2HEX3_9BACT|nr:dynamin family protein [Arcobacter porcinus]OCL90179.1 Bacterial dynamin-like protein [Aliarcobacter thereius]OCL83222.1 Bacterial dynamin-like protein [Arcobacter porcinus]OCL83285.1 Bacterial dynamin-like protein [Arcobacter porcinus]OCL88061.1 Bacterial dynamin-like protein [Arcobacter porcinus]QEP41367.1 GTP-binding protein (dynamin domain) [Arcobacter porcinus]
MSINLNILKNFTEEYKAQDLVEEIVYEDGLVGDIKKTIDKLLDEKFFPSTELRNILNKQLRRARYPMEVAITGQFSAGKSTFLNAILSRNILPTGITPVTSKVNFINYGDEYKLKITYHSGATEYAPIESIADFTDQRQDDMKNIKYLTLYAPMPILKEISFVDTPGLNSQSQSDTDVTRRVLKDVGGIIWLTLIDNAGKLSEAQVLEEYMEHFKNKSLCVLNQKDKLSAEQVITTTKYVEDKFSKYFAKVVPISAIKALEGRAKEKEVLIEDENRDFINLLKNELKSLEDENKFENLLNEHKKTIEKIKSKDTAKNTKLLEESNIQEVIDFIENVIRPQASEAKEFAIKKDLRSFCDILIKEYETILKVYDALVVVLNELEERVLKAFDEILSKYSKELFTIYNSLISIMEKIANETFKNIKTKKAVRFEESKSILGQKIERVEYETLWIDSDSVYKALFYDDQTIDKMFKKSIRLLKNIELDTDEAFRDVYRLIRNDVVKWQEPYELMKKNREIASDVEFSNTRHFAAKVYENVLKEFHKAILENISALRKKFAYFNGALSYSYIQVTQATIAHFEQQIVESEELYKKEPTRFSINHPREDEIVAKLKANFAFEKIEDFLTSKRNYLFKIIKYSKEQYVNINEDRIKFILGKKEQYLNKIEDLEIVKSEV